MEIKNQQDRLDVECAVIPNSCFDDVNLSNTRFNKVNLSAVEVCGSLAANTWFADVNMSGARFEDVNLSGARLDGVNLSNVVVMNANVAGMTINGVAVSDLFAAHEAQTRAARD